MAEPYTWELIEKPVGVDKWHGIVRHRVDVIWIDGILQDGSVDVWERRRATFSRGDRVIVSEGMGNYALGTYLGMVPGGGMAGVRYDGYIDPDGVRHEPYDMRINFNALRLAGPTAEEADAKSMLPGYTPIRATLDPDQPNM